MKIKKTENSFVVYTYNKDTKKEEKIFEYTNKPVTETKLCDDCENCKKRAISEEEIIERVRKLGKM